MIRNDATQRQVDAADPDASTWLSANAGSGKTRVLTDRVARLLLKGVSPQNILCLTYTKAAAAEMQNRLFKRLGEWAMTPDDVLRRNLDDLGAEAVVDLARARTLFASALETPGGLKIQTIHSFCSSILRRFPLEAGVSPQFREMEDRTAALLRLEVIDAMAKDGRQAQPAAMLRHLGGQELDRFLSEIAGKRQHFAAKVDEAVLDKVLGLASGVTIEAAIQDFMTPDCLRLIQETLPLLKSGGSNEVKYFNVWHTINFDAPNTMDAERVLSVLLTKKGEPRKAIFNKANATARPDLVEAFQDLTIDALAFVDTRNAIALRDKTLALHGFAHAFCAAYAQRKQDMGMLDFDDLIAKAGDLLTDKSVADWVLFRLDGGIDHVLVDEAQDTSPAQWKVIANLTQELTAGAGARDNADRSIFVVGDKKQSIYSFQGADPAEFDRMQDSYTTALENAGKLHSRELLHSFRSAQAVLAVVDATFNRPERESAVGGNTSHMAFHDGLPGRVDLWPVIPAVEKTEHDGPWYQPVDLPRDSHHDVQMAAQVAEQIKRMIQDERLPDFKDGKPVRRKITEGDFLILVQKRSALFSHLIRACKVAGLRVAGADRFKVGAVLAVKDIAALLNFLALPDDDLSLATALRSPLFGWSEQDLFTLAHHRPKGSVLWEALRKSKNSKTLAIIQDLLDKADFMRPFDLIDRILRRHDGRRSIVARLGVEAEDGIDAMLSQAMAYEQLGVPSLTGFLSWMETDDLQIKRQMDNQGNQIRVMSVHGAKGLEAPIVILPDCRYHTPRINDQILVGDDVALWKTNADQMPDAAKAFQNDLKAAQAEEKMRLLYVAMTRAEKWLIVGGAGDLGKTGDSWHDSVAFGMAQLGATPAQAGDLEVLRHATGDWNKGDEIIVTPPAPVSTALPILSPIPDLPERTSFAPSDLGGAKALAGEADDTDTETLLARGRLLHLLLEHQPDNRDIAMRLLSASPEALDTDSLNRLIDDAFRLFNAPHLAEIFGPNARAEVGITAELPQLGGGRINGAIDRLLISDDRILAVDFKSNRIVPPSADVVPEGVLRQLGAYHAALQQIYPTRPVEVAVLWTATAELMTVPTPIVAAALDRVTTS